MSNFDNDLPPVVAEPVRRDPTLSIPQERTRPEPSAAAQRFAARPRAQQVFYVTLLLAALVAGAAAALVVLGLILHELARVIMLGWRIG